MIGIIKMEQQKLKSVGGLWENEENETLFLKLDNGMEFKLQKTEKTKDSQPDFKEGTAALWKRISKKGVNYLFLKVGDDELVGFQNKKATEDQPPWNIFESRRQKKVSSG